MEPPSPAKRFAFWVRGGGALLPALLMGGSLAAEAPKTKSRYDPAIALLEREVAALNAFVREAQVPAVIVPAVP